MEDSFYNCCKRDTFISEYEKYLVSLWRNYFYCKRTASLLYNEIPIIHSLYGNVVAGYVVCGRCILVSHFMVTWAALGCALRAAA